MQTRHSIYLLAAILWAGPAVAQSVVITPATSLTCADGQVPLKAAGVWTCGTTGGTGTVTTGSALTTGTIPKASGAAALVDSLITESGSTVTVTGTFNATTAVQLNGTPYPSPSNVALLNATINTFQPATGTNYSLLSFVNTGGASYIGKIGSTATSVFTNGTAYATVISASAGEAVEFGTDATMNMSLSSAGLLTVGGAGTSSFTASSNGLQVVRVNNSNTTTPTATRAMVWVSTGGDATNGYLEALSSGFTTSGFRVADGVALSSEQAGGLSIASSHASGAIRFYAGGTTNWLLINTDGNIYARNGFSLDPTKHLNFDNGGDTYGYEASANVLRFMSGGSGGVDLTSGATAWAAVSDQRLKTDLAPITSAAWKLGQIRALTGRYTADAPDVRRSFLIAQDVRAVLPEAVSVMADGMFTLRYTDVIPLLVGGVNEIDQRLAAVEKQLGIARTEKASDEDAKIAAARGRVDRVTAAEQARVQRETAEAEQKRLAEVAKADKDRLAAEAEKAAADRRAAIRAALATCDADNAIIVKQGGRAVTCATSADERAELNAIQDEAKAATAKADTDKAATAKRDMAACAARNQKIVNQGGKPLVCGGVQ